MKHLVVICLLVSSCGDNEVAPVADASRPSSSGDASLLQEPDACAHVEAPRGPGPFSGCTCGDVLRISATNPDLVECVAP